LFFLFTPLEKVAALVVLSLTFSDSFLYLITIFLEQLCCLQIRRLRLDFELLRNDGGRVDFLSQSTS